VRDQKRAVTSPHRQRPAIPEIAIAVDGLQAPAWLKKDGLQIWERLAPALRAQKLLTRTDAEAFARYCRNFARWLKVQKELDKHGETYESPGQFGNKMRRITPDFMVADRIERQLLAAEDRFGLNPAERQRIFAARAAAGAPLDMFDKTQPDKRPDDPAARPLAAAEPEDEQEGPVGFLN
jgi:P27 family predicted phage terminase small subunit